MPLKNLEEDPYVDLMKFNDLEAMFQFSIFLPSKNVAPFLDCLFELIIVLLFYIMLSS